MGLAPNHPFVDGSFAEKNHPAIGDTPIYGIQEVDERQIWQKTLLFEPKNQASGEDVPKRTNPVIERPRTGQA